MPAPRAHSELHKIAAIYPEMRCVLRIRADDPDARVPLGLKYGADPSEAPTLLAGVYSSTPATPTHLCQHSIDNFITARVLEELHCTACMFVELCLSSLHFFQAVYGPVFPAHFQPGLNHCVACPTPSSEGMLHISIFH